MLLLASCNKVDFAITHVDYKDFYCHGIDDHDLDSPEHKPIAVSCGYVWHFDTPFGHKFPGEK
jgi:hypothetical protein